MDIETKLLCPVCGHDLGIEAWKGGSPSDEICPCCGIQFGYFDMAGTKEERSQYHVKWRKRWIGLGMPWNEGRTKPPTGWNPIGQLQRIEVSENPKEKRQAPSVLHSASDMKFQIRNLHH